MTQKKNSLVANINRRKKAGTSRPKSRSKVSSKSYKKMESGSWGKTSRKKTAAKKSTAKKSPARSKRTPRTTRKSPARKSH